MEHKKSKYNKDTIGQAIIKAQTESDALEVISFFDQLLIEAYDNGVRDAANKANFTPDSYVGLNGYVQIDKQSSPY